MERDSHVLGYRRSVKTEEKTEEEGGGDQKQVNGRRKIEIKYVSNSSRRKVIFSKRKTGILKKAYELSVLTGSEVMLLVMSESKQCYTFTSPKFRSVFSTEEGRDFIHKMVEREGLANTGEDALSTLAADFSRPSYSERRRYECEESDEALAMRMEEARRAAFNSYRKRKEGSVDGGRVAEAYYSQQFQENSKGNQEERVSECSREDLLAAREDLLAAREGLLAARASKSECPSYPSPYSPLGFSEAVKEKNGVHPSFGQCRYVGSFVRQDLTTLERMGYADGELPRTQFSDFDGLSFGRTEENKRAVPLGESNAVLNVKSLLEPSISDDFCKRK